jgi:hypothetical protein
MRSNNLLLLWPWLSFARHSRQPSVSKSYAEDIAQWKERITEEKDGENVL